MSATALLSEIRASGCAVTLLTDGRLSIKPAISAEVAGRVRAHKAEVVALLKAEALLADTPIPSDLDPFRAAVDAVPVNAYPAGVMPPVWDGLTVEERWNEERRWCQRNGYSYPEGLKILREMEGDRLAEDHAWLPEEVRLR